MKRILLFLTLCIPLLSLSGQAGQGSRATIMVVPFSMSDENPITVLEEDFNYAVVVNEINKAFNAEGYSPIDFTQKLKNYRINKVVDIENWQSIFGEIIDNSGADIIVSARIGINEGKYGTNVSIIIDAVETSSSENLAASGQLKSGEMRTDVATLAAKALNKDQAIQGFLGDMASTFQRIREAGRSIVLRVRVTENSDYDLDAFIGEEGDVLSEKIQEWVEEKCKEWYAAQLTNDASYKVAGQDASLLSYDFIRIPFEDAGGGRYDVGKFSKEIRKAIAVMGKLSEKEGFFKVSVKIERNKLFLSIE